MKAKYCHMDNDCLIYDQVICEDNIVTTVRTYCAVWFSKKPETKTKVCLTNAEARHMFFEYCNKLEKDHYKCIYKEVTT